MSSKKPSPKEEVKLDDKTLDKLYYLRFLFGILAGTISGIIPPQLGPFSLVLLILLFLASNNFMRSVILKNKTDPPARHGIGIYILAWIFFYGFVATLFNVMGIW